MVSITAGMYLLCSSSWFRGDPKDSESGESHRESQVHRTQVGCRGHEETESG